MAQLIVRNLEDDIKERLRRRAKANRRSMEEEAREILRKALSAKKAPAKGLATQIAERFKGIELEEEIPEWKGFPIRPPKFK